jgi:hypothetical protein
MTTAIVAGRQSEQPRTLPQTLRTMLHRCRETQAADVGVECVMPHNTSAPSPKLAEQTTRFRDKNYKGR